MRIDEEAVREFLDSEYPRVVGAVSLVTGDVGLAEDAVQEALARAWQRGRRGEEVDSLPKWVVTVALNEARSARRRRGAERRVRDRRYLDAEVPGPPIPGPDRVHVGAAVKTLPRRQREAVVLYYYLDMSVAEISAVLGTSSGTVKSALHRGRAALAPRLSEHEVEPT